MGIAGQRLFQAGADGRVLGFEPLPLGPLRFVPPELDTLVPIVDMKVVESGSPDRILLAIACKDEDLRLYQVPFRWPPPVGWSSIMAEDGADPPWVLNTLLGHEAPLRSVDAQGGYVLTAAEDKMAKVWDVMAGAEVVSLLQDDLVHRASFLPDMMILTSCADHRVRLWDIRSSVDHPVIELQEPKSCTSIAARPDGLLAFGCGDGKVRFHEPLRMERRCVGELKLPTAVSSQSFVADGRCLVCAGDDGKVYAVQMPDFVTDALEVQDRDDKLPIRRMWSHTLEDSRTLLMFAFREKGWSFAMLEESLPVAPTNA